MTRHHVHLSSDIETAIKVGKRHGKPVVIVINAYDMYVNGNKFHKTENDTWLSSDPISLAYEEKCIGIETCDIINKNRKNINKNKIIEADCESPIMTKISDSISHLSVKQISSIFNDLVKHNKGDYKVNICGSNNYYLYIIPNEEDKIISLDTNPDEFEEYFNED